MKKGTWRILGNIFVSISASSDTNEWINLQPNSKNFAAD